MASTKENKSEEVKKIGRHFNPPFGDLEITPFYANNEIFAQEIRFSVPAEEWSEFENSPQFQELKAYVEREGVREEVMSMEITIKGDPKEIAALVVALKERRGANMEKKLERIVKANFS